MTSRIRPMVQSITTTLVLSFSAGASANGPAAETGRLDFGLTERQMAQKTEKVEQLIAQCMRAQGFQYVAVNYKTVRAAMEAEKKLPGVPEEEFIERYGFGISTMYTGKPPQLATGYSPAKMGLGRRNVQIFKALSPADQTAYTHALTGGQGGVTFVVGLETEDFTRCGGCTRKAVEQVFGPTALKNGYVNPTDIRVAADPRMKKALREYARKMRQAGFEATNPNDVESLVVERLDAITSRSKLPVEAMSPDQKAALKDLQDFERRLAATTLKLEEEIIEPVEERILREMFSR